MATKKRKINNEGRRFQERWRLQYFFTEVSRGKYICLICHDKVSIPKEFNFSRLYKIHAEEYDQITGSDCTAKLKQLYAASAFQQGFFTQAWQSNENITKARHEVAMLMENGKPFTEGEFVKECMMKMVDNICPEKKQEFANVRLARKIEEISADIKRLVGDKGVDFDFSSLACDESTDISETAQLLIFVRGVDDDMNITEELLDLQSLKGQTRGADLFDSLCVWHDTSME